MTPEDIGAIRRQTLLHPFGPAEITSCGWCASKALLDHVASVERENDVLRGIAATKMPCHYCGATELAKCPHGFPGCALADDLLVTEGVTAKALHAARRALTEANDRHHAVMLPLETDLAEAVRLLDELTQGHGGEWQRDDCRSCEIAAFVTRYKAKGEGK